MVVTKLRFFASGIAPARVEVWEYKPSTAFEKARYVRRVATIEFYYTRGGATIEEASPRVEVVEERDAIPNCRSTEETQDN